MIFAALRLAKHQNNGTLATMIIGNSILVLKNPNHDSYGYFKESQKALHRYSQMAPSNTDTWTRSAAKKAAGSADVAASVTTDCVLLVPRAVFGQAMGMSFSEAVFRDSMVSLKHPGSPLHRARTPWCANEAGLLRTGVALLNTGIASGWQHAMAGIEWLRASAASLLGASIGKALPANWSKNIDTITSNLLFFGCFAVGSTLALAVGLAGWLVTEGSSIAAGLGNGAQSMVTYIPRVLAEEAARTPLQPATSTTPDHSPPRSPSPNLAD